MADLTARIKPKKSSTAGEVPQAADLEVAELAVNTADGKLFVKHTDNSIKEISGGGGVSGLPVYDGILMNFDGGDQSTVFADETGQIFSWTTNGSAKQVASPAKFGASALSCRSGTSDYLRSSDLLGTPAREMFRINKGDFTCEFWVYIPTGASTNFQSVFALESVGGSYEIMRCTIRKQGASGNVDSVLFYIDDGSGNAGSPINQQAVERFSYDTWHHLAFCRSGQVLKYFVDGVEHYSQANTTVVGTSDAGPDLSLTFGLNHPLTSERFDGYLDSFYYVPQAKYTGAFTPPTEAITPLELNPNDGDVLVYDADDAGYRPQALPLGYLGDVQGPIANAYTLTNKVSTYLSVANDGDWSSDVWGGAGGGYLISWEQSTAGALVLDAIQAGDEVTIYWPSGEVLTETVAQTHVQSTNNAIVINDPTNAPWNTQVDGTAITIQCKNRITTTALIPTDGHVLTWVESEGEWRPQATTVDLSEVGSVSYIPLPTTYRYDVYSSGLTANGQWAQDAIGLYVRKIDSDGKDITQDPLYPATNFWYSTDGTNWVNDTGSVSNSTNFFSWGIGNPGLPQNTLYVTYSDPTASVQDGQALTFVSSSGLWQAVDVVGSDTTVAGTGSNAVSNLVTISQVDYDALGTPDANTIYFIV